MQKNRRFAAGLATALTIFALACLVVAAVAGSLDFANPALAQQEGQVPGNTLGGNSDADIWRAIRQGEQGTVSIPNEQAGVLVQSEGENWRSIRNGPLSVYGVWAMLGIIALLALFFALRGRIRIEHGRSGRVVERFNFIERFAHWLTAGSFVVLALTGLNMLYGRYVVLPLLGPEIFSAITLAGKYAHNYLAFAFMAGLVLIFVLWIRDNIPDRTDAKWVAAGGGMFRKGVHPPAKRFNAGQKIVFWLVILGGLSVSLSGIALLFPFEFSMFSKTFAFFNLFGFDLPANLTPMQEMQLSHIWHGIIGLLLIAVIIAHIYIGTIGMEGAFDAMGSGMVDENWAREHHSLWVDELERKPSSQPSPPARAAGGDD
ncbi:formate dehydrogenase subunit gamma [Rhodospirillaceae bacterium SYSU D60014]|uniref:formate dehydrogenase subunit gamma n=1 Tax=Virgifigura deserti TaxID=2268457 RepID=UPI000E6746D8